MICGCVLGDAFFLPQFEILSAYRSLAAEEGPQDGGKIFVTCPKWNEFLGAFKIHIAFLLYQHLNDVWRRRWIDDDELHVIFGFLLSFNDFFFPPPCLAVIYQMTLILNFHSIDMDFSKQKKIFPLLYLLLFIFFLKFSFKIWRHGPDRPLSIHGPISVPFNSWAWKIKPGSCYGSKNRPNQAGMGPDINGLSLWNGPVQAGDLETEPGRGLKCMEF